MRVPTYDAAPGAKAFSGLGERLLAGMGWRKCVSDERDERRTSDDLGGAERRGGCCRHLMMMTTTTTTTTTTRAVNGGD
jgi:hypothetical protein